MSFSEQDLFLNLTTSELDDWYTNLHLRDGTLIFIFGLGNGIYLHKLLDSIDDSMSIILYEPDEEFLRYISKKFQLLDLIKDSRLTLYAGNKDVKRMMTIFKKHITMNNTDKVLFLTYPKYDKLYHEDYRIFKYNLVNYVNAQNTKNKVIIKFGKSYIRNIFNNYHNFFKDSKSFDSLKESVDTSLPVFVVSAGPSLDLNVKYLKGVGNRGYIIAVDTAIPILLKNGIKPDITVSVDALKSEKHMIDGLEDVPLLCYLTSNYKLLNRHNGNKLFIDSPAYEFHVKRFLEDHGILLPKFETGGSVSCTAFSVAQVLGFKTVVFVGLDLSYPNNQTYSKDAVSYGKPMEKTLINMVNNKGEQVISSNIFKLYKDWFEVQIKKHKDMNIYNATEGGARIEGAKILSLKECITVFCGYEKEKKNINATLKTIKLNSKEDYKQIVIDELSKYKNQYQLASDFCNMIITENNVSVKYNLEEFKEEIKSIVNAIENTEESYKMIYYVTYRVQKEIKEMVADSLKNAKDELKLYEIKLQYFNLMIKEIQSVLIELRQLD